MLINRKPFLFHLIPAKQQACDMRRPLQQGAIAFTNAERLAAWRLFYTSATGRPPALPGSLYYQAMRLAVCRWLAPDGVARVGWIKSRRVARQLKGGYLNRIPK